MMTSWEEYARNFLLEEEEEDDELFIILLPAVASGGKKRKQSHIGSAIEDYVEFKKWQTSKTMEALNEKKRQNEEFSVQKCLDEMDSMVGLTDKKSYALDIFKIEINRELFLKTKNQNVRFIWLKRQIRYVSSLY
jgi:hypothetical protein